MGPLAKKELPAVTEQVRLAYNSFYSLYKYQDKILADETAYFADPSFFRMFDFPLLEGNMNGFNSLHEMIMPISVNVIKDGKFSPAGEITDLSAFAPPEK